MLLPLELAVSVGECATIPEAAETRQLPVPTHLQRNVYEKEWISYLSFILDNERLSNLVLSFDGICRGPFEWGCYGCEWKEAKFVEIGYLCLQHLYF